MALQLLELKFEFNQSDVKSDIPLVGTYNTLDLKTLNFDKMIGVSVNLGKNTY